MSRKNARVGQVPPPSGADDLSLELTMIEGVTREDALQLRRVGISTCEQVALMSPEEIGQQFNGAGEELILRIRAERWVEQARALAERHAVTTAVEPSLGALGGMEPGEAGTPEPHREPTPERKGDTPMIVISLTLGPGKHVLHTSFTYPLARGGDKTVGWDGWDRKKLLRTLAKHAEIEDAEVEPGSHTTKAAPQPGEPGADTNAAPAPEGAPEPEAEDWRVAQAALDAAVATASQGPPPGPRLRRLEVVGRPGRLRSHVVSSHATQDVQVELDLSQMPDTSEAPQRYVVRIYARDMGTGARHFVGDSRGAMTGDTPVSSTVRAELPPAGFCRLETDLVLHSPGETPAQFNLRGDLFYVY